MEQENHNEIIYFPLLISLIQEQHFSKYLTLLLHRNKNVIRSNEFLLLFQNQKHYRLLSDENWMDKYFEHDFFQLFRMNQDTFNTLLEKIDHPDINKPYHGGGIPVPAHVQLLMTLWWLGKGETLLSVSERFGVSLYAVFTATERIINRLLTLIQNYICWPTTPEEIVTIVSEFQARCGFPGVLGAIDGTNIQFKAPEDQQESYIDKNSNHSIKLQAIGTANKLLTNIFIGFPGSAHDNRVFRNSGIFIDINELNSKRKYFPVDEYHLVGDKAYPLLEWVMTPYRNPINLQETRYNTKHSQTRIVIEHLFGLLKGRWRILKYINTNSVEKAVKIIAVCCILHNFCYVNADYWDENREENHDEDGLDINEYYIEHNILAQQKRNNILQNLL